MTNEAVSIENPSTAHKRISSDTTTIASSEILQHFISPTNGFHVKISPTLTVIITMPRDAVASKN